MPFLAVDPSRDDTVLADLAGQIPRRRIGFGVAPRPVPDARGKGLVELAREMAVSFAEHMRE